MRRRTATALALSLAGFARVNGARAVEPEAAAPAASSSAEEITVSGPSRPPSHGVSDQHIHVGALRIVPRTHAAEMLKLAPGILLTNEGGDGHAEQVFLRGFDAREGQDIEFSVGGVPINEVGNLHGNGYADTHFLIPEVIEGLHVIEGPFDPRQGNFAVAGSADFELGLDRRGLTTKVGVGSFGTQRLLLTFGPPSASKATFGAVELFRTAGYGANRDASRGSAIGQWELSLGDSTRLRLTAQGYGSEYHTAGVVRDSDDRAGKIGFFDTYDPRQGGSSARFSIAADLEKRSGNLTYGWLAWTVARSMRLRENFTGFLLDVQQPLHNPHPQRGDLLDLGFGSTTVGTKAFARSTFEAFGLKQRLELGSFARYDVVKNFQQRVEAATGHPYRTETDNQANLADLGAWVDLGLSFTRWLHLRGGLRADVFTFDVDDRCAVREIAHPSKADPPGDASCLAQQDYGRYREPNQRASTASAAMMPRATLVLGPIRGVQLTGSYGKGVRSIDPSYVTQDVRTPFASIESWEGGVAYARTFDEVSVSARSIFFQTHVDRDLIFSQTAGRNVLANGTTRTGWVGAVRVGGEHWDQSANLTLVRSTFDDTRALIPYVPDLVLRSDSAVFGKTGILGESVVWNVGAGVSWVGHRALPYGQRSDAIFTLDLAATLARGPFELGLSATNVFDARYRLGEYNYASAFSESAGSGPTLVPARHFTAGPPRTVMLSFAVNLGGGENAR